MAITDFLDQENVVLQESKKTFEMEIQAFDMINIPAIEVSKSISTRQVLDGESAYVMVILWQIIHAHLRLAFIVALRGHNQEVFAVLRPGIEMCSHLPTLSISPKESSLLWLKLDEKQFKRKYKQIYVRLFYDKTNLALKELESVYLDCCDIGSHAGHGQLGRRGDVIEKNGAKIHELYDFNVSSHEVCKKLLYILKSAKSALLIFKTAFGKTLSLQGFEPPRVALKMAIQEIDRVVDARVAGGLFRDSKKTKS